MMWMTLCAAGRLDEAEALAAPGVAPRRGVVERDLAVLRGHVALLRLNEADRREACEAVLAQLARSRAPLPLSNCMTAAAFGCAERAFDLIEEALDRGRPLRADAHDFFGMARAQSALQLFVAGLGEPIWRHRRFTHLCARLGLAQYWLESGKWPDCAAAVDYDFAAACREAAGA
jgi:hypothetical protein